MRRFLAMLAILLAIAGPAGAQSIRHIYRTAPSLVGLGGLAANGAYQNAADLILETAIRNLPLFPSDRIGLRLPLERGARGARAGRRLGLALLPD